MKAGNEVSGIRPENNPCREYGMEALTIPPATWKSVCAQLSGEYTRLVCLWGVDRESEGMEVLAHVRSIDGAKNLVVKSVLPQEPYRIDSLCDVWCSAELYEDEIYDLFGVTFTGHPFLRRLFLADDFEGYPLRKNYGKVLEPNSR